MEEHVPDWSFASATPPTTTSTSDLSSSFASRIENVPTLPKADVLQHNYLLHKASSTPFEISGTDQGYDFHDIFNTLQNCQLINTARAGAEALPEHTVPLSWDFLCNPNQAEASGSGSKRRSNIEMDDGRGCKRAPEHCREQGADHGMREDLKDQRKARVKRTRSAELHNMSERKRRDRIREKIQTLQQLIPNCNKPDRASVLDDAIKYLKGLKLQVEMLATRGASTLDPCVSPGVSSANRAGNVNQGLLLQIRRPIIVMGPSYGLSNTSTGLSAMPFQPSPLFPTSPPLRGQAVSFPFVGARPQRFSPAASSAVNIGFFPPFSHWNSNPTPSAIERQACEASNLTERVMVHRTITPSSPKDYTARVQDPVWTDNRSFSQIN